jgi:putative transposase
MSPARRLEYRDYSSPGIYFVTACANFKRCIFGDVANGAVEFSALGRIVEEAWIALAGRYSGIRLHSHVVMPNHVHGIVEIAPDTLAQQAAPLQRRVSPGLVRVPLLSVIVRSFKADVTRRSGIELGWKEEIWQRNYFDRVIRDGQEFSNAMRYIAENPIRWQSQAEKVAADGPIDTTTLAQRAAPLQRERP